MWCPMCYTHDNHNLTLLAPLCENVVIVCVIYKLPVRVIKWDGDLGLVQGEKRVERG